MLQNFFLQKRSFNSICKYVINVFINQFWQNILMGKIKHQQFIGLSSKFVWVFPYNHTEKPKWTWPTQCFLSRMFRVCMRCFLLSSTVSLISLSNCFQMEHTEIFKFSYVFNKTCCTIPISGLTVSSGLADGILILLPATGSRSKVLPCFWDVPFPKDPMPTN